MASLFRPWYTHNGVKRQTRRWYGQYRDAAGKLCRVPLSRNKAQSQVMLGELIREADEGRDGSTFRRARKLPLADHLAAWQASLASSPRGAKQRTMLAHRVRRVVDGCGWRQLGELDGAAADAYLAGLQQHDGQLRPCGHAGISAKTRNGYADALKQLGAWLESTGRLPENPFARLTRVPVETDRRHDRRPLLEHELRQLLESTKASNRTFQGLDGPARYTLYLCAVGTGFRAGELACLLVGSFALGEAPPVVHLPARRAKNRRSTAQPIPAALVPVLHDYLAGRDPTERAWPGTWPHDTAEMLQADLAAAVVPYVVQGPDGPLYADFHALRHTFISLLDRPDVSFKEAMELARHSDPRLTAKIYAKASRARVAAAADRSCTNLARAADGDRGDLDGSQPPCAVPNPPAGRDDARDSEGRQGGARGIEEGRARRPTGPAETDVQHSDLARVLARLQVPPTVAALIAELVRQHQDGRRAA